MSTEVDYRNLTDTELQELFEAELPCQRRIHKLGQTILCDKTADWIMVCKHCGYIDFECDYHVTQETYDKPERGHSYYWCSRCKTRKKIFSDLMRLVGKV